jgi:hypothetical protein
MIIPVKRFTCGKVIGDKWEYFVRKVQEQEKGEINDEDAKHDIVNISRAEPRGTSWTRWGSPVCAAADTFSRT